MRLLLALTVAMLASAAPAHYSAGSGQQAAAAPDAEAALRKAEDALRANPALAGGQRARAEALEALQRWPEAAAAYGLAVAQDPADLESLFGLTRMYRRTERAEQAIALLDKLLASGPNERALFERALAFSAAGQPDKALADYDKLIAARPFASALYNRGWIFANREEYAKAVADFERALALDPKDLDTFNSLGSALTEFRPP